MKLRVFSHEDFTKYENPQISSIVNGIEYVLAEKANQKLNDWLEKNGKAVYAYIDEDEIESAWYEDKDFLDTHKAILVWQAGWTQGDV